MNLILGILGEGHRAHRLSPSAANLAKIERGDWIELGALGCSAYGRAKVAPDGARLCKKCFHGDTRTAAEWRAAQAKTINKPAADALFAVFGMKEKK